MMKIGLFDNFVSGSKAFGIQNMFQNKKSTFGVKNIFEDNSANGSFKSLRNQVDSGLTSVAKKLTQPLNAASKSKLGAGLTTKITTAIERRFEAATNVSYQKLGNISTYRQESQVKGQETIRTASESQGTVVTKNGKLEQSVQFNQQQQSLTNIGSELNRVVNSQTGVNSYTEANKLVKEWNTQTTIDQNQSRLTDVSRTTDLERTMTTVDNKGNVIGEQFLHRETDVTQATDWQQQLATTEQKDVRQETTSQKEVIGDVRIVATQIKTEGERQAETEIVTTASTDTQIQTTDFNKDGTIKSDRTQYLFADSVSTQNTSTQEETESLRNILTLYQGQQSVTLDKTTGIQDLIQTTLGKAEQVTGQLDAEGNVIAQKTTVVDTQTTLERTIQTENDRMIARGPEGVIGAGQYTEESLTNIETERLTNGTAAVDTTRQIDSSKTIDWQGSIQKEVTGTGANYTIQNFETNQIKIGDVTTTGQNKLTVETEQGLAKTVEGMVSYQAADAVNPVQSPAAQVAINFGTYTGLSTGFKMDNGEVSFRLSFSSAQMTDKETVRSVDGEVVSDSQVKTGEINDAELVGTLKSYTTDDGRRVVEVIASYVKNGEKFAVEQADDAGVGLGSSQTNVEIKGSMVIAGTASDKSIESSFEMYKTEDAQAEGTSASAVGQALDISDPLRKSFTFDRGIFSFQLGFASLNMAVYA